MDERLRQLEREAAQGDPLVLDQLIHSFLRRGDIGALLNSLRRIRQSAGPAKTIADSFIARVVQLSCGSIYEEDVRQKLRDELLVLAVQTGVWHGVLALLPVDIARFNQIIRMYRQRSGQPIRNFSSKLIELYTYLPANQVIITDRDRVNEEVASIDAHLVTSLRNLYIGISWIGATVFQALEEDAAIVPGIPIEKARISGEPWQILGSYRILERTEPGSEVGISREVMTSDGNRYKFETVYPEMQLHIVECRV